MPQFNISLFLKKLSDCLNEYSTQSATFTLLFNVIAYSTDKYEFSYTDKKISNPLFLTIFPAKANINIMALIMIQIIAGIIIK